MGLLLSGFKQHWLLETESVDGRFSGPHNLSLKAFLIIYIYKGNVKGKRATGIVRLEGKLSMKHQKRTVIS